MLFFSFKFDYIIFIMYVFYKYIIPLSSMDYE